MSQVSFMERLPTITSSNACIMQAWCFFVFKQGMVLKVSIIACCSSVGVNEDHVVIQGEERSTMDAQEACYSIPALKRQVGRGWWLQMVVCLLLSSESAPQLCNISGRFLESQNFFLGCNKFFFNKYQSIIETFCSLFLAQSLSAAGLSLVYAEKNLVDLVWADHNRPDPPFEGLMVLDISFTGQSKLV